MIHDHITDDTYCPLAHLAEEQAPVEIYNSPLSESGVLASSMATALTVLTGSLYGVQFGDFVNVAQVVIDQFIVSAEDKWNGSRAS